MKNKFTVNFDKFYESKEKALIENDEFDICETKAWLLSAIEMAMSNLELMKLHIDVLVEFPESNIELIKHVAKLAQEKAIYSW